MLMETLSFPMVSSSSSLSKSLHGSTLETSDILSKFLRQLCPCMLNFLYYINGGNPEGFEIEEILN